MAGQLLFPRCGRHARCSEACHWLAAPAARLRGLAACPDTCVLCVFQPVSEGDTGVVAGSFLGTVALGRESLSWVIWLKRQLCQTGLLPVDKLDVPSFLCFLCRGLTGISPTYFLHPLVPSVFSFMCVFPCMSHISCVTSQWT